MVATFASDLPMELLPFLPLDLDSIRDLARPRVVFAMATLLSSRSRSLTVSPHPLPQQISTHYSDSELPLHVAKLNIKYKADIQCEPKKQPPVHFTVVSIDWIKQGLTSHSTHFRSFRRRWGDCGISQDCSHSQSSPTVCAVLSSVCATTVDNSGVYVYYLKGNVSECSVYVD